MRRVSYIWNTAYTIWREFFGFYLLRNYVAVKKIRLYSGQGTWNIHRKECRDVCDFASLFELAGNRVLQSIWIAICCEGEYCYNSLTEDCARRERFRHEVMLWQWRQHSRRMVLILARLKKSMSLTICVVKLVVMLTHKNCLPRVISTS